MPSDCVLSGQIPRGVFIFLALTHTHFVSIPTTTHTHSQLHLCRIVPTFMLYDATVHSTWPTPSIAQRVVRRIMRRSALFAVLHAVVARFFFGLGRHLSSREMLKRAREKWRRCERGGRVFHADVTHTAVGRGSWVVCVLVYIL